VTIANYTVVPVGSVFQIAIAGVIEISGSKCGLSQNFILQELENGEANLWIVSEVLAVFGDAFLHSREQILVREEIGLLG
jgi:hypothetical protein